MEKLSRFITYPTILEKEGSYTAIVIDCSEQDTADLQNWLATSSRNLYDIYFYNNEVDDLPWLNNANILADVILINDSSRVKASHGIRYGVGLANTSPLHFLKQIDVRPVDTTISSVLY